MTLKRQCRDRDPIMFDAIILKTAGGRHLLTMRHLWEITTVYMGIKWSRDRWRHVTLKGQGRDANMIRAQYLETAGDSDLVTMERL